MVEHVAGVLANKSGKSGYITFITNFTKDCDCLGRPQKPLFPDIGVLASTDPVTFAAEARFHLGRVHRQPAPPVTKLESFRHAAGITGGRDGGQPPPPRFSHTI